MHLIHAPAQENVISIFTVLSIFRSSTEAPTATLYSPASDCQQYRAQQAAAWPVPAFWGQSLVSRDPTSQKATPGEEPVTGKPNITKTGSGKLTELVWNEN
jgi:hypothetical protein